MSEDGDASKYSGDTSMWFTLLRNAGGVFKGPTRFVKLRTDSDVAVFEVVGVAAVVDVEERGGKWCREWR